MGNTESAPQEEGTCECGKPIAESCAGTQPYNTKLVGTMKHNYNRHLILCSGLMDWPERKPEKSSGTFINALTKQINSIETSDGAGTMLTLCSDSNRTDKGTDILVYPEGIRYIGVTEADLPSFVQHVVVNGTTAPGLVQEPIHWEHVVLVCTHGTRDKRCGRIGPQVVDELKAMLEKRGVSDNKVAVLGSSHLGGHKFAAVVVVYPEGDWYGQMTNKNAESLLDSYLDCKKVYRPGFRGKMGETVEQSKGRLTPAQ